MYAYVMGTKNSLVTKVNKGEIGVVIVLLKSERNQWQ